MMPHSLYDDGSEDEEAPRKGAPVPTSPFVHPPGVLGRQRMDNRKLDGAALWSWEDDDEEQDEDEEQQQQLLIQPHTKEETKKTSSIDELMY